MKRTDKRLRQFWKYNINSVSGYVVNRQDSRKALKKETKKYYTPEESL
jgi:hypothetical protein